jgi:hypothetical protein
VQTTDPAPVDLEYLEGLLWVSSERMGTLQPFDVSSDQPVAGDVVSLGAPAIDGAWTGNDVIVGNDRRLYVTQYDRSAIAVVDPADPTQTPASIQMNEGLRPLNGVAIGDSVWVTAHDGDSDPTNPDPVGGALVQVRGGEVVKTIPMPFPPWAIQAVTPAPGSQSSAVQIWVTFDKNDEVGVVDPDSAAGPGDVDQFALEGEPIDMVDVGGSVWISLRQARQVAIVSKADRSVKRVDACANPHKLLFGFDAAWVVCEGPGARPAVVLRLDPASGSPQQAPIGVGAQALEIAASERRVFVVDNAAGEVVVLAPARGRGSS